ncbi:ATP-binding protein [Treponema phagedenis]|uniref:ATP-binding protein n=1 Tax=Treponema phagedenis TaxID=162 RepID=UPI00158253C8|nr:ATP-binding protein [Treponema phagedenis]QKS92261.1 sensor histidine kinase [Treponema phagedenis]
MKRHFSITPRIIAHFGEDLIKNESIAILELVKNSYDACASKCKVEFTSENKMIKKIVISDDGTGMNADTIQNVWLVIGTDHKKTTKKNECGRYPLGEKGIGRLGVHKLGKKIKLFSKTAKNKEVELFIDWTELEHAKQIEDFGIEVTENEIPKYYPNGKTGTKIIIEDLKSQWDRRQIREVYRNLLSLNSPFANNSDSFDVDIYSNENIFEGLPKFEDIIENGGLYFGSCTLKGKKVREFKYEFRPWSTLDKLEGRKVLISDLSEEDLCIKGLKELEDKKRPVEYNIDLDELQIGEIKFDIIIFEKDAAIFNFVNTEKKSINDYLSENGGIRVYRDNVRVYDYGERDNDWLGIDLKRVHRVGGNISNNIVLGSVRLNRRDSIGLREKTNREGFIEDECYNAFVDAINYVLNIFVRERNVDKTHLTTLYKTHKVIEPVLSDLGEVINLVEEKVANELDKKEILKYLYRINDQYKDVKETLIKSANAGLNLSVVIHEIDKLTAALLGCAKRGDNNKIIELSLRLEKIVRGYTAMIRKSAIKETELADIVNIALENYEFRFSDHLISVHHNSDNCKLMAFLAKAEAISVLTNLLDNSIYWLSYARKEDRKISVYITGQIANYNSIIVSDNGPGFNIPADVAVQPFITGKPYNIGMGLGLHIVNEMMNAMKGKLLFLDENDIELPKYIKDNQIDKAIIALCFPRK